MIDNEIDYTAIKAKVNAERRRLGLQQAKNIPDMPKLPGKHVYLACCTGCGYERIEIRGEEKVCPKCQPVTK